MELTGKQILIAGAASDIGQAIVTQISHLGAKVVMLDNSEEKLLEIQKQLEYGNIGYYAFEYL